MLHVVNRRNGAEELVVVGGVVPQEAADLRDGIGGDPYLALSDLADGIVELGSQGLCEVVAKGGGGHARSTPAASLPTLYFFILSCNCMIP